MSVLGLDHVQLAIPSGGEAAARRFWINVVGLDEARRPVSFEGRSGLWLALAGSGLHLGVEPDFRPARKAHPAFRANDLEALADRIADAGAPVDWNDDIPGARRFFSQDPFGNRLEFIAAA